MTEPLHTGNSAGKPDSVRKPGHPVNSIHNLQRTMNRQARKAR